MLLEEVIPDVSHKWYYLGILLDLSPKLLSAIKNDCHHHDNNIMEKECCINMLHEWLTQKMNASWPKLLDALRKNTMDKKELANVLERKYILPLL